MDASPSSKNLMSSAPSWARDLWHTYVASGDVTALLVTTVLLAMPALALDAADWPLRLNITIPVMIISLFFGYFLARSRYDELYALLVSSLYGGVIVLLAAALSISPNIVAGLQEVVLRAYEWITDAATGGINQDTLVFTMVVSLLFWFFGYNATWHIFRIDGVWRVIIPPALILIVNRVVYTGDAPLDWYLMTFTLMSLLLIVRSNLEAREWDWYVNQVRVPQRVRRQFIAVGTGLSLLALVLAWAIPSGMLQERLNNFQQFLASDPVRQMSEFLNRLVAPIESDGPATADYYGGDSLNLGGAIRLGDQVIMLVDAPTDHRYYWRSRVFERYDGGRWLPSATRRVPDLMPPLTIDQPPGTDLGRTIIDHTVTMSSSARLIYTAPQPLSVNLAGRIDLLRTGGNQDDAEAPVNISVIRPERVIESGMSYTVTSEISTASADDLRSAGQTYPEWVLTPNAYAGGISGQVAALARQITDTAGAVTSYDQAKAIERYLRTNITYNETIPRPPAGVDPVEWFLFDIQQGYCTYYATAMVTMLRTLGIPARMAAGFSQGELDASLDQYVVRERDAHTWVEVYFPGYGWVEFEPTSAQQPLNRDGDDAPPQAPAPAVNQPTQPPTSTPTPLASPTPEVTPTPAAGSEAQQGVPPTPSPTPSPSPTATPVIVPTVAPPVQPPDPPRTGFLSFLLPAVGIAFLIFGSILLLILLVLFIYWWWEWRALGGVPPVTRAYLRLMRYLSLLGLQFPSSLTPEERREHIVSHLPNANRPVTAITRAYTEARYQAENEDAAPEGEHRAVIADNAWLDARRNILQRWLRRLIPFLRD